MVIPMTFHRAPDSVMLTVDNWISPGSRPTARPRKRVETEHPAKRQRRIWNRLAAT